MKLKPLYEYQVKQETDLKRESLKKDQLHLFKELYSAIATKPTLFQRIKGLFGK